ncbi:hypothetical protein GUITHDRAFT_155311, partial [Guillardia theta CCMP2712]
MSNISIYDCVLFNNEIAMLYFRMHELFDVVDYYVVVEATTTFSGKSKSLIIPEKRHLFKKFEEKLIYFPIVHDLNFSDAWQREQFQRDCILRAIPHSLKDQDIVMLHDCDEIPNRTILEFIRSGKIALNPNGCTFPMDLWYFSMNFPPFADVWRPPNRGAVPFKKIRSYLQHISLD